ncbi:hypothetical protein F5876DRAFT_69154 [Lentinula aff. lateritia]|uniref:Uncharacterized protein n=1 Tax=Lentinula aff. lateritia TaxID=2804960 RepID=A0ACC1TNK0_9AGAR|nr:hypothetical protein F5876DRAFT_69154 [Lentinula aff. lateritia]
MSENNKSNAVAAWFLGPKGENAESLCQLLTEALEYHVQGRIDYFPGDPSVITPEVKASATFQINANNVALEASPLTPAIKIEVGKQLAQMVGYYIMLHNPDPIGWGHITADGSIANLESMWAADKFHVDTCTHESKLLKDFTTWELLNILPTDVLNIPTHLNKEYSITAQFLQDALNPYLKQTIGKEHLECKFQVKPMAYFASTTMH